jgi:hypothetical protein
MGREPTGTPPRRKSMPRQTFYRVAMLAAASLLAMILPAWADSQSEQGQGVVTVTVLPDKKAPMAQVPQQNLSARVNGKDSNITGWKPAGNSPAELVLLIDGAARASLGTQMSDIQHFINSLPPNTKATLAYMENGRAELTGPLTTDRAQILRGLRLPAGGVPGVSASPYFCLADLASHWPSNDESTRREVVMITDGVDYYDLRYDPDDPYVQNAVEQSVRAHLVVYSIYWRNIGRIDRSWYQTDAGQNLLTELTQATGGNSYWQGYGNPVSLQPYFDDIERRLDNQYELAFMTPSNGRPQVANFRLKVHAPGFKIDAPQQVLVVGSAIGEMQ